MENQTPGMTTPPTPPPTVGSPIERRVTGPAIALLITAIIGVLFQVLSILGNFFNLGMMSQMRDMQQLEGVEGAEFLNYIMGAIMGISVFLMIIAIIVAALIIIASIRMKKLQGWGLAVTAGILAMIPCISPCCIIGLPIGIWSLVVLMSPEVKAAFK